MAEWLRTHTNKTYESVRNKQIDGTSTMVNKQVAHRSEYK